MPGRLDARRQLCTVDYDLVGGRGDTHETHVMRFFFPAELELFLEAAGFELAALTSFADLDRPAGTDSWTATVVARAL